MPAQLLGVDDVARAAAALTEGRLVAFPTETVYGLGADAGSAEAVAGVFTAKGRPMGHPLIVHIADAGDLGRFADRLSADAEKLASAFWPGPLTIIVERGRRVAPETAGGRSTVGIRVPDHPVARRMIELFGGGVAGPSANRFGSVSPTTAKHVMDDLGSVIDYVVDGGPSPIGVESTIVDLTGQAPLLLRPGGVSTAALESVLGRPIGDGTAGPSRAPGMLTSHYAPRATVELITASDGTAPVEELVAAAIDSAGTDLVGVIGPLASSHRPSWQLPADAAGYAGALYATLREADGHGLDRLLVVPPTTDGALLHAVLDRLAKAAAPR